VGRQLQAPTSRRPPPPGGTHLLAFIIYIVSNL
jgi:hypothetical protein